jgi:uncharacterized protein (TIGR02145 family)
VIIIMKMCNEWTTHVWNGSTWIYSVSAMGGLYQWGNNTDVAVAGTSTIPVNTASYNSSNPYYWNWFITQNPNWSQSINNDLWGNTVGTPSSRRWMCPLGYHIPSQTDWYQAFKILSPSLVNWNSNQPDSNYINQKLRLPSLWFRNYANGTYLQQGAMGFYWSSTPNAGVASSIIISSSNVNPQYLMHRAQGAGVRCFKN